MREESSDEKEEEWMLVDALLECEDSLAVKDVVECVCVMMALAHCSAIGRRCAWRVIWRWAWRRRWSGSS